MYRTDSRKVKKGDIFVALRGISSDGHDYIESAIKNGASKIVCEEGNYEVETIIVDDTRKYIEKALYEENKEIFDNMKIIGITGTNGKTTIAYFLYQLLNKTNNKTAYLGTIGYYLDGFIKKTENTTPDICDIYELLIDAYSKKCKYFVLEVSSQGLDYGRVNNIPFECSIYTNLTMEHLDFHKTMENYALSKQKLFKQTKCAIINIDDEYKDYFLLDKNYNITYGYNSNDYKLKSFKNGILEYNDKKINTNLLGLYNAYNLLATIACLDYFKINNYEEYILKLELPEGRFQRIKYNNSYIVVDYAHTPDSYEQVIKLCKEIAREVTVVFGCRGNRLKEKRPIMGNIASSYADRIILTEDCPYDEDVNDIIKDILKGVKKNNYEIITNRSLAIKKGMSYLKNNDILLILGKGHEDYIIENGVKKHYNDCEEVIKLIDEELVTRR